MNRDFLSGVNHEHHQEAGKTAAPLLSAKEPQRVEKLPKPETPKTDAAQNPITSNPFLLDFFKGSIEQSKNIPKNSDNLDGNNYNLKFRFKSN